MPVHRRRVSAPFALAVALAATHATAQSARPVIRTEEPVVERVPPLARFGLSLGLAHGACNDDRSNCTGLRPYSAGGRAFALWVLNDGFGFGLTHSYARFRVGARPDAEHHFTGYFAEFGTDYSADARFGLWLALGHVNTSGEVYCGGPDGIGLEAGVRVGFRLGPRWTTGVTASAGGGGSHAGVCAADYNPPRNDPNVPISGLGLFALEIVYELPR